jgi:thioredoxin reductase (NADPH)
MYDIIIIGAGPAGLTASIYARRALKSVLVMEKANYGGQIVNSSNIENYPGEKSISGVDFANKLYEQAKALGIEFVTQKVIDIKNSNEYKEVITSNNTYKCKSVIIATGSLNRKLDLDNEDKFIGKGVSYCATCDGTLFRGKDVAVVGGGNTALEDALYLSNLCNKVYLIHRRDSFRGDESTLEKLKNRDNIEILCNSVITKIMGNNVIESIELNNEKEINVSGLFIAIGRVPNNNFPSISLDLDENGYILSSEDCHTNIEGIFVAGDNRHKDLRQLVTATSDGAIAATEAIKYLSEIS